MTQPQDRHPKLHKHVCKKHVDYLTFNQGNNVCLSEKNLAENVNIQQAQIVMQPWKVLLLPKNY